MKIKFVQKQFAFTLTEVLIAIVIVGVISGLVLPIIMTKYQENVLNHAYNREVQAIASAVDSLVVTENKSTFFETSMYSESEPENYDDTAGKFLKKYMRTAKYCGSSNGKCFANTYYQYQNKDKTTYEPEYTGACAALKNGMSICIKPQIGTNAISGIIDLNGPKGPNVYGRDLRNFIINTQFKMALDKTADGIYAENSDPIDTSGGDGGGESDDEGSEGDDGGDGGGGGGGIVNPCMAEPYGLACCQTKSITSEDDQCCLHKSIFDSNKACNPTTLVTVTLQCPVLIKGERVNSPYLECPYSVTPNNVDLSKLGLTAEVQLLHVNSWGTYELLDEYGEPARHMQRYTFDRHNGTWSTAGMMYRCFLSWNKVTFYEDGTTCSTTIKFEVDKDGKATLTPNKNK